MLMFMNFCHSCAAPIDLPEFQGPAENYCIHCTDEQGTLKSHEEIKAGVVEWMKTWQPDLDDAKAQQRAEHYLKAMPAWAN
jgi:hypothetical protein